MEWKKLLCGDRIRSYSNPAKASRDMRSAYEKDYRRIIGSASFRRMQDKTQVFPLDQSDFVRTRLTHSLEVSSFGKSLGQMISARIRTEIKDPGFLPEYSQNVTDILQCAGLIHDIGNPPFGHFGETAIREWFEKNLPVLEFEGEPIGEVLSPQMREDFLHFEGNTQAFRLVTKLHFLVDDHGMNLTKALLSTIIKYPVSSLEIDPDSPDVRFHKMGYDFADKDNFQDVEESTGTLGRRHPLAFALEAADDIAYRTADMEDGFRKGMFSFGMLQDYLKEKISPDSKEEQKLAALLDYRYQKGKEMGVTDPEDYAIQNWMVNVQGKALQAAADSFILHYDDIMEGTFQKELLADTPSGHILEILGEIAVRKIFHSKRIYKREIAEEVILDVLLDKFVDAAVYFDTGKKLKPTQEKLMSLVSQNYMAVYQLYSSGKSREEKLYLMLLLVTDYICGMTDHYARTLYQELTGMHLE